MRNFALDVETHDLVLDESRNLAFTKTPEEMLAQRLTCKLKAFLGEWYLDRRVGVPYFEEVLVKNPNIAKIRALLLSVVSTDPQVARVLVFDVDFQPGTREFLVNFKVQAHDGTEAEGSI